MKLITLLSPATKGEPITSTRHYAQIPLINKPLILHTIEQLGGEVEVLLALGDEELKSFLEEHQITFSDDLTKLREASQLIPGDILLTEKEAGEGILTVDEGSEETEMLQKLLTEEGIEKPTTIIDSALRINYPWEILTANTLLSKTIPDDIDPSATIEEGVTIKGNVAIGKNTIVKAGSYIEGPVIIGDDCLIGPMAHLRPETALGNGVTIGKTEVYDVVIMSKSVSKHHAYVAHSVLGEDVNVGAFSVTADYRHDAQEHLVFVKGEKVPSSRRKVGAFIGDHARLGISTSFYPGRKIWPNGTTLPGEIVSKDKEKNKRTNNI